MPEGDKVTFGEILSMSTNIAVAWVHARGAAGQATTAQEVGKFVREMMDELHQILEGENVPPWDTYESEP